jgi:hypothetical protein
LVLQGDAFLQEEEQRAFDVVICFEHIFVELELGIDHLYRRRKRELWINCDLAGVRRRDECPGVDEGE